MLIADDFWVALGHKTSGVCAVHIFMNLTCLLLIVATACSLLPGPAFYR